MILFFILDPKHFKSKLGEEGVRASRRIAARCPPSRAPVVISFAIKFDPRTFNAIILRIPMQDFFIDDPDDFQRLHCL
jgi:hypothetical protein